METNIERLFDLISTKAYQELNKEELEFVLSEMTREEYELQRTVISATEELEYPSAIPLALEESGETIPLLKRSIPLYQVLIGAACLTVGFFLFSGKTKLDLKFDSSFIEFQLENSGSLIQLVHDTVFKDGRTAQTKLKYMNPQLDTVYVIQPTTYPQNTRMLEPGLSSVSAIINEKPKPSAGVSSRNDKTTNLLPAAQTYTSMK